MQELSECADGEVKEWEVEVEEVELCDVTWGGGIKDQTQTSLTSNPSIKQVKLVGGDGDSTTLDLVDLGLGLVQ